MRHAQNSFGGWRVGPTSSSCLRVFVRDYTGTAFRPDLTARLRQPAGAPPPSATDSLLLRNAYGSPVPGRSYLAFNYRNNCVIPRINLAALHIAKLSPSPSGVEGPVPLHGVGVGHIGLRNADRPHPFPSPKGEG